MNTPALPSTPKYQLVADAEKEAGLPVSSATIRRWLRSGRVRARRIGAKWCCTAEDLRAAMIIEVGPGT